MWITGADRKKLNQAITDGFYKCAPETTGVEPRSFKHDDLCALFVFGKLLEIGMPPRLAGPWACSYLRMIQAEPKAVSIHIGVDLTGKQTVILNRDKDWRPQNLVVHIEFPTKAINEYITARTVEAELLIANPQ